MKLEQQVVSLELAKQLKELGVKQDSLFYWWISNKGEHKNHINFQPAVHYERPIPMKDKNWDWSIVSAFTVAELGEMLPMENEKTSQYIEIRKTDDNNNPWSVGYRSAIPQITDVYFHCSTLVNAMTEMLIWLIENGYLKESK